MKLSYTQPEEYPPLQNKEEFSLKKWLTRMVRLWPWFLLSLLVCLSLTYLYLRYTNPVYKSVASIIVKDEKKGVELMDNSMMKELGLGGNNKLVENEIEVLKSYDLMEAVVNNLQLFIDVRHTGRIRDVAAYGNDLPFKILVLHPQTIHEPQQWMITDTINGVVLKENNGASTLIRYGQTQRVSGIDVAISADTTFTGNRSGDYKLFLSVPADATMEFGRRLNVEAASKVATVINLEMKDANKKRAVATLQALIDIYNIRGVEDKNRVTDNTVNFLTERLTGITAELQGVEGSVEKFKSQNRVTELSSDAKQYLDLSQQVDIQKAQSQTRLNIVNALEKDLLTNEDNPKLVPSTLGIEEPSLGALIEKHNELVLRKERLENVSGPKNPALIDVQQQIKEIRSRMINNVGNLKQAYAISLNDVAAKDRLLNGRIRNVPLLERKLVQITRNQNVQEQLYAFLLQKREEAAMVRASNIADSRTILQARNIGAIAPRPRMAWTFGLLIALLLPVSIIGLRDFMNNKIGGITEIQKQMQIPVLGTIPHIKRLKNPVVINSRSRSAAAEQIRNIRTAISFTGKGKNVKTILLTSFQPGEGKSFASLNLGVAYSLLGKKTVILEFDLRKPGLAKNLDLHTGEGISSILAGKLEPHDLLVEVPGHDGNLFLLRAGNIPPNPAELISGPRMAGLMKTLEEEFDYIIIDSPPLNVVTDATLLQKHADITIIVLRENYTSKVVYERLNQRTAQQPDEPVYIILNDTGRAKRYEDNYGYSSGYYHDNDLAPVQKEAV